MLDQPVTKMKIQEGPAFGAAMIAGVGAGVLSSLPQAADRFVKTSETIPPDDEAVRSYAESYPLFQNLYSSLKDDFEQLSELQL